MKKLLFLSAMACVFAGASFAQPRPLEKPASKPVAKTPAQSSVAANVKQGTGMNVFTGSLVQSTGSLAPGRRAEIFYNVTPNTSQIVITVSNFASTPNPSPQNIFPEQIYLQVHSAKTSQIGGLGDYFDLGDPFITGGTFTVNNPETGVMRIPTLPNRPTRLWVAGPQFPSASEVRPCASRESANIIPSPRRYRNSSNVVPVSC